MQLIDEFTFVVNQYTKTSRHKSYGLLVLIYNLRFLIMTIMVPRMMMIPLTNRTVEVTGLGFPAINTDVGPSALPITATALFLVSNTPAIIRTLPAKPVNPQIHFLISARPFCFDYSRYFVISIPNCWSFDQLVYRGCYCFTANLFYQLRYNLFPVPHNPIISHIKNRSCFVLIDSNYDIRLFHTRHMLDRS